MIYKEFIEKLKQHFSGLAKGNIPPLTLVQEYQAKDILPQTTVANPGLARKYDVYLSIKRANDIVYKTHKDHLDLEEDEATYIGNRLDNSL